MNLERHKLDAVMTEARQIASKIEALGKENSGAIEGLKFIDQCRIMVKAWQDLAKILKNRFDNLGYSPAMLELCRKLRYDMTADERAVYDQQVLDLRVELGLSEPSLEDRLNEMGEEVLKREKNIRIARAEADAPVERQATTGASTEWFSESEEAKASTGTLQ